MKRAFALIAAVLLWVSLAAADGDDRRTEWVTTKKKQVKAEPTPNQASDASFDKRLPPVLPGEIVNDSGRKMKVWSTAGPVPVSGEPEPWNDSKSARPGGKNGAIGVIVDRRKGRSHTDKLNSDQKALKASGGEK